MGEGHGTAVDWWSLGTLVYEMLVGRPPFQNANKMQLLYTIATRKVDYVPVQKVGASPLLTSLLRKLLHPDPAKRLGGQEADADDIKKHPFFEGLDWEKLSKKELPPLFRPVTKDEKDTSNIDKAFLGEKPVDSPSNKHLTFSQQEKVYFDQFTYNRENDDFLMDTKEDEHLYGGMRTSTQVAEGPQNPLT